MLRTTNQHIRRSSHESVDGNKIALCTSLSSHQVCKQSSSFASSRADNGAHLSSSALAPPPPPAGGVLSSAHHSSGHAHLPHSSHLHISHRAFSWRRRAQCATVHTRRRERVGQDRGHDWGRGGGPLLSLPVMAPARPGLVPVPVPVLVPTRPDPSRPGPVPDRPAPAAARSFTSRTLNA